LRKLVPTSAVASADAAPELIEANRYRLPLRYAFNIAGPGKGLATCAEARSPCCRCTSLAHAHSLQLRLMALGTEYTTHALEMQAALQ